MKQMRANGQYPITVKETTADVATPATSSQKATKGGIKVARLDVINLSTQLAVMLETGITLAEALECAKLNCEKPKLKALVESLHATVSNGVEFSAALSQHPRSFPTLYIALIKASEKSGMLSKLINRATNYLRDEQDVVRKVRGAITYPAIMLLFALSTTGFLLAFVMPRFTVIYANKGAALPMPTQLLMGLSAFLTGWWMVYIPAVIAMIVGGYFGVQHPTGARIRDWIVLRIPLIGPMLRKMNLARALRMIGTMNSAGVSLVECVETAGEITCNSYFKDLWTNSLDAINSGRQLSEPLSESNLVPGSISRMLYSGEKGGKLGAVMEQVAGYSEMELKEKIADVTRYIEPIMIVMMGGIIGTVTLALLLPVFTISKVVAS